MKLLKVLENLDELLESWNINASDWILVANYAYKLLGYDVPVRKVHFNVLVRRNKIPWEIKEGIEIHPPRGTKFRTNFQDFIRRTGFDFDLNLASDKYFESKKGYYIRFKLPNKKSINVQKPEGAIKELEKLLMFSTENELGTERIEKEVNYIKTMIDVFRKSENDAESKMFAKLLTKYLKAKNKVKVLNNTNPKFIKGIIASPGRAKGTVVIVNSLKSAGTLNEGNILVTQNTTPVLLAFLPKVRAIVTDWGGRLSHAAILAREMGIPCIVGTQTATILLKTGDFVEVDAIRGVVRKLDA